MGGEEGLTGEGAEVDQADFADLAVGEIGGLEGLRLLIEADFEGGSDIEAVVVCDCGVESWGRGARVLFIRL